jgi:predicted CXXCH cytochrome family protein
MPPLQTIQRRVAFEKLGVLAGIGWLLLVPGCSRKDPSPNGADRSSSVAGVQEPAPAPVAAFAASLPRVGGPAGYVGSKACRSCHEDQFGSWHRSYHRTMTQVADADTVQADFHNIVLTNDGVRFVLSQKSNEFRVRMEDAAPGVPGEALPKSLDVRIGLVTGSHHMQVFWVPGDEGNTQIGFPFTWLIPEKRWVPRNSTFVRPPDLVHRAEVWNVICSRCHATGIEPRVDSVTRTVDTRAAELGITCEACHGPGQRHAQTRLAEQNKARAPDRETLRSEIVHPKKIDPARASQICGFCHSMKWIDRSETWQQHGFRYRPGDDLEQTTPIIRPSRVEQIHGLADFLSRNPNLLLDFFWPDGMIRVSGREYNGLLESPCYKGGKFSCLSCHSLHESDPDDQLARNRIGNRACTQCHEQLGEVKQLTAHTRHLAESSGSECYNCHMPHTSYGVLKAIRSHQISSPRIADELTTGRPNACNLCHLDKPLDWTADRLAEWYRHPIPKLSEHSAGIAHALRLALSGDAGQRVLIAWHLSWPSALQTSGTNWIPPVLGQLLDDPYAAVRCVADRSLRTVSGLTPPGYDYVEDPRSRPPAREMVWASWQRQLQAIEVSATPNHGLLVRPDDLTAQRAAFDQWLRQRNDRALRLRE